MKKIITSLFFIGIFTTSFAQYNQGQDSRNYNSTYDQQNQFGLHTFNPLRERDFQIQKINRDFDFQIRAIESNCYMSHHEKRKAIRNAKRERERQIQIVNERFNSFRFGHERHDHDFSNW